MLRAKNRSEKSSLSVCRVAPRNPTRQASRGMVLDALQELSVKDAAAVVAAQSGLPRREVYSLALRLAGQRR